MVNRRTTNSFENYYYYYYYVDVDVVVVDNDDDDPSVLLGNSMELLFSEL